MKIFIFFLTLLPTIFSTPVPSTGVTGIRPVPAGVGGTPGRLYTKDFTVCPRDYPKSFNLECVTEGDIKSVEITLGDWKPRTERVKPYMAAGDKRGNVYPLKGLPRKAEVKCAPNRGEGLTLLVSFECEKKEEMPRATEKPKETEMPKESMKPKEPEKPEEIPKEEPRMKPTEEAKPTEKPEPSPETSPAPSKAPAPEPSPAPSKEASPEPSPEPTPSSSAKPKEPEPKPEKPKSGKCVGVEQDGRIVMDAKTAGTVGEWVEIADGIEYKPNGGGGIEKEGTDVLYYDFIPSQDSHYLFTYEVTAPHPTEHNDAFFRFSSGGGLRAQKPGEGIKQLGDSWVKAYNNEAKRSVGGWTVDHNRHTIVSAKVLKKGQKYTFELGARSTKFKVHNLLFIACEGDECYDGSYYRSKIGSVKPTGCA